MDEDDRQWITDEQERWEREKRELDLDTYYWEWLVEFEQYLNRELGNDR